MKLRVLSIVLLVSVLFSCMGKKGDKGDIGATGETGAQGEGVTAYEYSGTMVDGNNRISVPALTVESFVRQLLSEVGNENNFDDYPHDISYDYQSKIIILSNPLNDNTGRIYKIIIYTPTNVQAPKFNESSASYLKNIFR